MEKATVYFTDFRCPIGTSLTDKLRKLCIAAGIKNMDLEGKFVAIKMHFGELGNLAFLRPNYAKVIADLCKERGFTQIKMQMLTGIDQSAYSKIERGERYLSFEQCRRVALALDTSMDYLAGLTDEKKPYPRRN